MAKLLDCTVIGDVLIDYIIHIKDNLEKFYNFGGTSYTNFAKTEFGGSGNIAVGLSVLGGNVSFIGKAGNDLFRKLYIENLKKNHVFLQIFLDKSSSTGSVLVLIHDLNERSFVVFRGANDNLSIPEIERADPVVFKSKYLYFTGCSLVNDPQRQAILHAIDIAKNNGVKIIFDPGAHNLVHDNKNLFSKLLDNCDVFTPNLSEASEITNTTQLEDIIDKLKGKLPLTALKCGHEGCVIISEKNVIKIPPFKVQCIDPTGAGDAFIAALIYGLSRNLSLIETGRLANWFASRVIQGIGARNYPKKSAVKYILTELKKSTSN